MSTATVVILESAPVIHYGTLGVILAFAMIVVCAVFLALSYLKYGA